MCRNWPDAVGLLVFLAASAHGSLGAETALAPAEGTNLVPLLASPAHPLQYTGTCDVSGGVALSSNLFAVADDENNVLRMYRADQGGPAVKAFDCSAFLEVQGRSREADLEAGARLGDRIFWIGSHGRNRNAKERLNRDRFFATDIVWVGNDVTLVPVGRPYKYLLDDLLQDPRFERFHFAEASRHAPKEAGALNIEGLSATPDGHLIIGFRNPVPKKRALLIPLLNPNELLAGIPAKFGPPIMLHLGGRSIRDIAYFGGSYLISAGSYHGGGDFQLYRWAGPGSAPEPCAAYDFSGYHPETILIYPEKGLREVELLSDDGLRWINGCPCKALADPRRKSFRGFWVNP